VTEVGGKLGAVVLAAVRTRTAPGNPIQTLGQYQYNHIVSVFVAYDFEHLYRSNENTNPNKRIPVTVVYSIYFSETILNRCAPLLRPK